MACHAAYRSSGYVCPVRGCDKKKNRRYSLGGMTMHLADKHMGYLEKKLNLKFKGRV